MLKYIFSILLIGAVWTVVLLLELPMWIAIVATAVVVAILVTLVVFKVVKAKKAAREIEKALQAQAQAQAASARPDLKADIEAMQGEFLKAVAALKSSKLGGGKRGAEALYALPWYMIIGPPGAGKSTALRNSGLRFPYLSKSGGGVQGVGGTRNCQWWMTNEAVILDTAGRYTTEETDRDEWMTFLDLLKKNRSKQPVNGVLVAIAVTDLVEAHPEEVLARAREIRARIDEVMGKLEMVVPVYVLFTKVDLLPGFVETFSDLGNAERNQIWGFTVPVTKKNDPAQLFSQHFTELAATVERRGLRRLHEERRLEARDKIYEFPQYFEPLRDNLSMFIGEMMAESIYTESPIFRGAYFTSGTQEGRPIDRIMNSMAEAFGIQPRMNMTVQPQTEAKSYFLGDVFTKVVFADKNVATRSAARMRRQALMGHGIAAALFLLAVGLAVLPVLSFQENRAFVNRADDSLDGVAAHVEEADGTAIEIEQIEPLLTVERELDEHAEDGAPLMMRMGMYQGGILRAPFQNLYMRTVREELVRPLMKMESEKLQDFALRYEVGGEQVDQVVHEEFKNRLRLYLLLTGPREENEPGLDEEQRQWAVQQLGELWAEPLRMAGDVATRSSMEAVAQAYIVNLTTSKYSGMLLERDDKLVKRVRKILRRTDRIDAMLAELIKDVEVRDLSVRDLTSSDVIKADRTIAAAYTRQAWENTIRERLELPVEDLVGQEWVLGRTEEEAQSTLEDQAERLRSLYFENYIKEWKGFLNSLYIEAPSNYIEAKTVFEDLTRGAEPPAKRLCHFVWWHTDLQPIPEPEVEEGAKEALTDAAKKQLDKKTKGKASKIAGALDRDAPGGAGDPLIKTRKDVSEAFKGFANFGYIPQPPAPEGSAPPPPPDVPADRYQEDLRTVRDAIIAKINIDGDAETTALKNAVKSAKTSVDALINESDTQGWTSTFQKLLPVPFDAVWRLVGESVRGQLAATWCESVVKPMRDMRTRYPFATSGKEASLAEFEKFFKPGTGALWTYYGEALAGKVPRKHDGFEIAKQGADVQDKINPQVVTFLNAADDLSRSMFPVGTDGMVFPFKVRIGDNPKTAVTELSIDGKTVTHKHGPQKDEQMQWPGEGEKGAKLSTRGKLVVGEVERGGDWGLFRLLEKGTVSGAAGSGVFTARWDLDDQRAGVVKIIFRPEDEDTPFFGPRDRGLGFMEVFRRKELAPPDALYLGEGACQ